MTLAPLEKRWRLQAEGKDAGGYVWAAAYSRDPGRWLIAHGAVRRATHRLWDVDESGTKGAVLSLGKGGEPAQVAFLDKATALVPDVVLGRVHRVGLDGKSVSAFGDDTFRTALEIGQKRYNLIDRASMGAIAGMLILPFSFGLFFVARDQKRAKEELGPLPEAKPITGEIWIGHNPAWRKMQGRLIVVFTGVMVAAIAMQFLFQRDYFGADAFMTYLMGAILVVMCLAAWVALRDRNKGTKRRLGVKEGFVLFDKGKGHLEQHAMLDVLTDGQRLLVGRHTIAFGIQGLPSQWSPDQIRSELLARLPKAAWVSQSKLTSAMYGRNPAVLALLIGTGVIFTVALFFLPDFVSKQGKQDATAMQKK